MMLKPAQQSPIGRPETVGLAGDQLRIVTDVVLIAKPKRQKAETDSLIRTNRVRESMW